MTALGALMSQQRTFSDTRFLENAAARPAAEVKALS